MKTIRIGSGAGYAGDRIIPALDLIERGNLDYIVFECLAERTIALAQLAKSRNPNLGYDPMLEARMRKVIPACHRSGTRLISNMGAANPIAAAGKMAEIAQSLGLNLRIAAIDGDDVLSIIRADLADGSLISANAYIGAEPIRDALSAGADIVVGGRIADPALFLGALMHEFKWDASDFEILGRGILVGHLLECAGQLSGGYFADPPFKQVPDIAHLGFPYADVFESGDAEFSKLEGTGGAITLQTCKEQLLYEIHDPASYFTPDVVADFSGVDLEQVAPDRVRGTGASGRPHPETLKVSLGYMDGHIGEGQISYVGSGAADRAKLAASIVREQLAMLDCKPRELRCDFIGCEPSAVFQLPTIFCEWNRELTW
jgi:Acyclic terpene utilisation family protein AtuA